MKKYLCLLIPFFIVFLVFVYIKVKAIANTWVPTQTYKPVVINLSSDKLFQLVNEWRVQNGYQVYLTDQRLCNIAHDRSNDLDYNHTGFRKKYSDYPYVLSENIVYNYPDEQSSLNGWLGSQDHLTTLEKPYKYSCISCVKQYCVQIFSSFSTNKNNPY